MFVHKSGVPSLENYWTDRAEIFQELGQYTRDGHGRIFILKLYYGSAPLASEFAMLFLWQVDSIRSVEHQLR